MSSFYRVLVLILFVFVSCESEDDTPVITGTLEGVWQLDARIYDGMRESLSDCERMQYVTFLENEVVELYWLDTPPCEFGNFSGSYNFLGEQLSVSLPQWVEGSGTYTVNYKVLLLDDENLRVEILNDSERGDYPDEERTILIFVRSGIALHTS